MKRKQQKRFAFWGKAIDFLRLIRVRLAFEKSPIPYRIKKRAPARISITLTQYTPKTTTDTPKTAKEIRSVSQTGCSENHRQSPEELGLRGPLIKNKNILNPERQDQPERQNDSMNHGLDHFILLSFSGSLSDFCFLTE